jgi:hypothetical protein
MLPRNYTIYQYAKSAWINRINLSLSTNIPEMLYSHRSGNAVYQYETLQGATKYIVRLLHICLCVPKLLKVLSSPIFSKTCQFKCTNEVQAVLNRTETSASKSVQCLHEILVLIYLLRYICAVKPKQISGRLSPI